MFSKLLNTVKSESGRTRLEDFTTELLVGVLQNNAKLRNAFCKQFLGLNSDNYTIVSQQKHYLQNNTNCIVDIVITGEKDICFIENKVNSKEGYFQLERYADVLDNLKTEGINTKLVYCTKREEPKQIERHRFKATKWNYIAAFCKKYTNDILVKLFLDFLNQHDMNTDMTIRTGDLFAMESFRRIYLLMDKLMANANQLFIDTFLFKGSSQKEEIEIHNRICTYKEGIVNDEAYSELLFGIDLSGKLFMQIYLSKENKFYNVFVEMAKERKLDFSFQTFEDLGGRIYLEEYLHNYLNDDFSEEKINTWFSQSFKSIKKFIFDTQKIIEWKLIE